MTKWKPVPGFEGRYEDGHEIAVVGRNSSGGCNECARQWQRKNRGSGGRRHVPRPRKPKAVKPPKLGYCHAGLHKMTPDNTHESEQWGEQCLKCLERAEPKRSGMGSPGSSLPPTVGDTTIPPEIAALARRRLVRHQASDLAEMLGLTEEQAA